MVVTIGTELRCGQYSGGWTGMLCGKPTTLAIVTPTGNGVCELLPICEHHLEEAAAEGYGTMRDGGDWSLAETMLERETCRGAA